MEKQELSTNDGIDELTEILARGCLRLILKKERNGGLNTLKGLDNSTVPSD